MAKLVRPQRPSKLFRPERGHTNLLSMNKKKDTYVEANLKSEYLHHYEENMKISNGLQETGPGQKLRSFNKATLEISSLHNGKNLYR